MAKFRRKWALPDLSCAALAILDPMKKIRDDDTHVCWTIPQHHL